MPDSVRGRGACGRHARPGRRLGWPASGPIGDGLWGTPEAFLFLLAGLFWFSMGSLWPVVALGWAARVGYWRWTGAARRRRFLGAWYAGAAWTGLPFWPLSDFTAVTGARSPAGVLATALVLPLGDGR